MGDFGVMNNKEARALAVNRDVFMRERRKDAAEWLHRHVLRSCIVTGLVLKEISDNGFFRELGYDSFKEYAEYGTPIGYNSANKYLKIGMTFGGIFAISLNYLRFDMDYSSKTLTKLPPVTTLDGGRGGGFGVGDGFGGGDLGDGDLGDEVLGDVYSSKALSKGQPVALLDGGRGDGLGVGDGLGGGDLGGGALGDGSPLMAAAAMVADERSGVERRNVDDFYDGMPDLIAAPTPEYGENGLNPGLLRRVTRWGMRKLVALARFDLFELRGLLGKGYMEIGNKRYSCNDLEAMRVVDFERIISEHFAKPEPVKRECVSASFVRAISSTLAGLKHVKTAVNLFSGEPDELEYLRHDFEGIEARLGNLVGEMEDLAGRFVRAGGVRDAVQIPGQFAAWEKVSKNEHAEAR